jgi:hypothetical protein
VVSRIPVTLNFNSRYDIANGGQIVRCQFHGSSTEILFETVQLRGSGDGYDPRLLCEQPCQRDLGLGRFLLVCNLPKRIHRCLICFASFHREARNGIAEVGLVELCFVGDCSRKETLA